MAHVSMNKIKESQPNEIKENGKMRVQLNEIKGECDHARTRMNVPAGFLLNSATACLPIQLSWYAASGNGIGSGIA